MGWGLRGFKMFCQRGGGAEFFFLLCVCVCVCVCVGGGGGGGGSGSIPLLP